MPYHCGGPCFQSAAPLLGPALTFPTLSGVQPLRYPQFVKMLRQFLKDIGLPAQMFAGHSFSRGGAFFAMQAGLLGEIMMQLRQWSSDACLQYLEIPLSFKDTCMQKLPKPCLSGNVHLHISVWYHNFQFISWLEFCTMLPLLAILLLLPGWALDAFLDYSCYGYWYLDI